MRAGGSKAAAALLLLLTVAALSPAASARSATVVRHRTAIGGWRLEIARDAFSGEVACRLREARGRAFYQGGAIGFRVAHGRSAAASVYRIDGGTPRAWRDDLPELMALGTPVDTGPMADPNDGIVRIPWRVLAAANSVAIQAGPHRSPRTFRLGVVHGLRALALARGCTPDARFVR